MFFFVQITDQIQLLTFMKLADVFYTFHQLLFFLTIEAFPLALLAPCSVRAKAN